MELYGPCPPPFKNLKKQTIPLLLNLGLGRELDLRSLQGKDGDLLKDPDPSVLVGTGSKDGWDPFSRGVEGRRNSKL